MNEEKDTPTLLRRIGHLFRRSMPEEENRRKEDEPPPGEEHPPAKASFSALDLRDRVVVMLLFDQVVCIEQVGTAWRYWQNMDEEEAPDDLWRVVARLPAVDRERVYAQAARVYAFEPMAFRMYGARKLLRDHRGTFSQRQWRHMVELNVMPVDTVYEEAQRVHWTFASHDPTRPAVKRFLSSLNVEECTLYYAPQSKLEEVLEDVFPGLVKYRRREEDLPLPARGKSESKPAEERQRIEDLARGSSFVETVFGKMEAEANWIEAPPRAEARADA